MNYDEQLAQVEGYGAKLDSQKRATAPTAAQRTAEWLVERTGHCTASMFAAVLDRTKKGDEGAKRRNYRVKLAVERLIGEPTTNFVNAAMEWGIAQEAAARMAYEARTGAMVQEVGFIHHPEIKWVGGSPDGLLGEEGMIEIKCPFEPAVHVTTLLTRECAEHLPQIQGLLWVTGRKYCDFISYDPRMPRGLEIYVQRIARDEKFMDELAIAVTLFLSEVDALHKELLAIAARNLETIDTDTGEITAAPQMPEPATAGGDSLPLHQSAGVATHTERIKTALHYASPTINARFAAWLLTKGFKSADDIPVDKAGVALAWIEKRMDLENSKGRVA